MRTVRFTQVVAKSGQPETYTLWTKPEADRAFMAAVKAHRVMTVHQDSVGTRTDHGTIGYTKGAKGSLLVFPKSLKAFVGKRVVGIRYDLLAPVRTAPPSERAMVRKARVKAPVRPHGPSRRAATTPVLRVYEPTEEANPPVETRTATVKAAVPSKQDHSRLVRAIKKAMQQLEQGKAVAAFQTLETALQPSSSN